MTEKKKYDSTLARIAGNIAGSIWIHWQGTPNEEYVAETAVSMAAEIVARCEDLAARDAEAKL